MAENKYKLRQKDIHQQREREQRICINSSRLWDQPVHPGEEESRDNNHALFNAEQREIRDCFAHIFVETYDHHNSLDQVVTLDWRTERREVDSVFTVLMLTWTSSGCCCLHSPWHTNSHEFQRLLELFYVFWFIFVLF